MKEIIFNLSKQAEIESKSDFDLIDLRYSITNAENKLQKLVDLDLVAPKGLELYKKFIAEIVKDKELLSIKVSGFSVYWITDCAVKGYAWHWGRDFFLMIAILKEYQKKIENNYVNVLIYIPVEWGYLKKTLKSFVKYFNYKIEFRIIKVQFNQKSRKNWLNFIRMNKGLIKNLINLSQLKSKPAEETDNLFFVSLNQKTSTRDLFVATKKIFNQSNKELSDLPYYWRSNDGIPDYFYQYKPTFLQQLDLLFQLNLTFFKSIFLKDKDIDLSNGLTLSNSFIKDDLIKALIGRSYLLYFYLWLKSYFSSIRDERSIYYEDEFYKTGRIISQAALNFSNIKSYGLQHGHFMESHTVYVITQAEVEAGLPIPYRFISWGGHYNQMLLQHNELPREYVVSLGNPNYILSSKKNKYPQKINRVLWCLTSKECMIYEWEIIKKQINLLPLELIIRLHPNPHILKSEVIELLGNKVLFSFDDSPTVLKAMQKNDLILVSAHSTSFIDAIVAKRKCIRLKSIFWDGVKPIQCKNLYTVSSPSQFKETVQNIMGNINQKETEVGFLKLSSNNWKKFINEQ